MRILTRTMDRGVHDLTLLSGLYRNDVGQDACWPGSAQHSDSLATVLRKYWSLLGGARQHSRERSFARQVVRLSLTTGPPGSVAPRSPSVAGG